MVGAIGEAPRRSAASTGAVNCASRGRISGPNAAADASCVAAAVIGRGLAGAAVRDPAGLIKL
jgi:hypothetical protein